ACHRRLLRLILRGDHDAVGVMTKIVAHSRGKKESGDTKRRTGFDHPSRSKGAAHVIAELRLVAIERHELVPQKLVGSVVEAVPIEGALGGASGEVGNERFTLARIRCVEPIEQLVDRGTKNQVSVHERTHRLWPLRPRTLQPVRPGCSIAQRSRPVARELARRRPRAGKYACAPWCGPSRQLMTSVLEPRCVRCSAYCLARRWRSRPCS